MRIYLTGFMGAGKTTVGKLLAERAGWPFVDLDGEIEAASGQTVREIFGAEGEAGFRRREMAALERTLGLDPVVVATGGGTMTVDANRRFFAAHGVTVWLHPPFATLLRRIAEHGKFDRPLFRDAEQARALYQERLALYRRADHTVEIGDAESPVEVATRIALRLGVPLEAGHAPSSGGVR